MQCAAQFKTPLRRGFLVQYFGHGHHIHPAHAPARTLGRIVDDILAADKMESDFLAAFAATKILFEEKSGLMTQSMLQNVLTCPHGWCRVQGEWTARLSDAQTIERVDTGRRLNADDLLPAQARSLHP